MITILLAAGVVSQAVEAPPTRLWDSGLWDTGLWDRAEVEQQPIGGGHAWKGPVEQKYRVHSGYEDKPKKKRKREKVGEQVILAGEPEIQTGIIEVQPAWDALAELQQRQAEAEAARLKRLRAIAQADDDWLMVA